MVLPGRDADEEVGGETGAVEEKGGAEEGGFKLVGEFGREEWLGRGGEGWRGKARVHSERPAASFYLNQTYTLLIPSGQRHGV